MMFFLFDNVPFRGWDLRKGDRKNTVSALPTEFLQSRTLRLDPQRGAALDFLHHIRSTTRTRQRAQQMDMIIDSSDNDGLAIKIRQDAAQVTVQFLAQGAVSQIRTAVLGGENRVYQDFRQGLRHAATITRHSEDATLSG